MGVEKGYSAIWVKPDTKQRLRVARAKKNKTYDELLNMLLDADEGKKNDFEVISKTGG